METRYFTIKIQEGKIQKQHHAASREGFRKLNWKFVAAAFAAVVLCSVPTVTIAPDPFVWESELTGSMDAYPGVSNYIHTISVPAVAAEPEQALEMNLTEPVDLAEPALPDPENTLIIGESLDVPTDKDANTGAKTFMSYKAITNKASDQYAMQQDAWTDENGFRRYGDYYMVALGTFYSKSCGETFLVTLDTGVSFQAITGDIKADEHTDSLHQHRNGNIVEFIVDSKEIPKLCRIMGDMSYANDFSGKIAAIERIVENSDE